MEYCIVNGELYHHGTKGMRWGVRRYQNKDGTLTEAGKKRYAKDAASKDYDQMDEGGTYYRTNKKGKRSDLQADPNRYALEDAQSVKRIADESGQATNKLKNISSREMKRQSKQKMDLSDMTDQEMREQINRAMLERQYNDMFAEPDKSMKTRERVDRFLEITGDVITVTGSAVAIAVGILELKDKLGL